MKKILFLVGVLAALGTSFTLTACGGGSSTSSNSMSMGDFARGAKEFQLLPNNGMVGTIYAAPSAGPTTTLPHGSSIDDAESVIVSGYYRAGTQRHPMIYTYTKLSDSEYDLSFTHEEEITTEAVSFIRSLGFGTTITDEDGGNFVATNIDSLSGLDIHMTFDMNSHLVHVVSSMTVEVQDPEPGEPAFETEVYKDTYISFRVLPNMY